MVEIDSIVNIWPKRVGFSAKEHQNYIIPYCLGWHLQYQKWNWFMLRVYLNGWYTCNLKVTNEIETFRNPEWIIDVENYFFKHYFGHHSWAGLIIIHFQAEYYLSRGILIHLLVHILVVKFLLFYWSMYLQVKCFYSFMWCSIKSCMYWTSTTVVVVVDQIQYHINTNFSVVIKCVTHVNVLCV